MAGDLATQSAQASRAAQGDVSMSYAKTISSSTTEHCIGCVESTGMLTTQSDNSICTDT